MTFDIEVARRTRHVVVEPVGPLDGGLFRVTLDGTPVDVNVARTDLGLSLIFAAAGRSVDVAITDRPGGEWLLQFPHVDVVASVDRERRYGAAPAGGDGRAGEQRVLAPMPGRVVRLLVKAGDEVGLRQGLVVIEAMKMENELGSPKAGRVKDVHVTEGAVVEAGRLLVTVE